MKVVSSLVPGVGGGGGYNNYIHPHSPTSIIEVSSHARIYGAKIGVDIHQFTDFFAGKSVQFARLEKTFFPTL